MDIYGIPERYHDALRRLIALPDPQIERLCTALAQLPLGLFPGEDVAEQIAEVLSVTTEEAQEPAELLLSLYFQLSRSRQDLKSAAENVVSSLPPTDASSVGEVNQRSITNLTKLLSIESLYVKQNATGLLYERANLFNDARILTDIRPVFPRDLPGTHPPSAFLITHTLRVSYSSAGGEEDIFLAMDAKDLEKLMELVERAKAKERVLKSVITATKIPTIGAGS